MHDFIYNYESRRTYNECKNKVSLNGKSYNLYHTSPVSHRNQVISKSSKAKTFQPIVILLGQISGIHFLRTSVSY